ncbi:MAG: alpha/beta hydrolase [Oscillospiraceae bacterium]|jgi:fermentation-respiration switch protein FrsA (DUF1100 family)|nr:alpha/beta hydrolase [Oscillospiraceae bacterium]
MKKTRRSRKKFFVAVFFCLVVFFIVLYFCIGFYFYNYAIAKNEKNFMKNNSKLPSNDSSNAVTVFSSNEDWTRNVKKSSEEIKSFDGLKLSATSFKQLDESCNKWIIVVHGYASNQVRLYDRAQAFFKKGFNVLCVDCRGCGDSEGDYMGMGWIDRLDVIDWAKKISCDYKDSKIALYGCSMGGSAVMMAAGETDLLPKNVLCVIEDCGYTSVWDIFSFQLKEQFNLPSFIFLDSLNTVTKFRINLDIKEASSVNQLKKSKLPIFFIHGDADLFVPFKQIDELLKASEHLQKEVYIVKGASHNNSFDSNPSNYMNKVLSFLEKHFNLQN